VPSGRPTSLEGRRQSLGCDDPRMMGQVKVKTCGVRDELFFEDTQCISPPTNTLSQSQLCKSGSYRGVAQLEEC